MSNDLLFFESFAKGKKTKVTKGSNCVIYTRVSTKEQADNNMSLETQRKACELHATKNKFSILGYFGGTYESAKTDERKEFNNMLTFLKKSKEAISYIIVYSVDRFSRSGANAIYIAEKLKKEGINVFAVSQPTDSTTASGSLQQNIQFIFSEYDNQLRREKCMAGVKEKLMSGVWCSILPTGYDSVGKGDKKAFVLNEKGKFIKKAFAWKSVGLSNEAIREKLESIGWKIDLRRITDLFRNPFYCGIIAHNALEGAMVEGIQEKAVSRELFLQVNGILDKRKHGYSTNPINEEIPLKRFLICDTCRKYMRAYKAYKNQEYYYKCGTEGCCSNKRADKLHESFKNILSCYNLTIDKNFEAIIKIQMCATYNQLNKDNTETLNNLNNQIKELDKKLERLEERLIDEDIDKQQFLKYDAKFKSEKMLLAKTMAISNKRVSNLDKVVNKAIEYSTKLNTIWACGDYHQKQQLQFLVFPDGILYNRKKDECRTERVNSVFSYISQLAWVLGKEKSGHKEENFSMSALVEPTGLEPVSKHIRRKLSTCLFTN
jgi:site-specific DNA recombinase